MPETIDRDVELVEDLLLLEVVSLKSDRVATLLEIGAAPRRLRVEEALGRRRELLETLFAREANELPYASVGFSEEKALVPLPRGNESASVPVSKEKAPVPSVEDAESQIEVPVPEGELPYSQIEFTDDDSQNPEYKSYEEVVDSIPPFEHKAQEGSEDTNLAHSSEQAEAVIVSETFFNELFPTKPITKQKHLPRSFPNIDEFKGDMTRIGEGFSGLVFKSTLRGRDVVLKVSKRRSEKANRADYHEWSVSERLKPHPNVLQIVGLCPSFRHPLYKGIGTTALIAPLQEHGGLRSFFDSHSPTHDDILSAALGMIQGIRSLHEQGVVHRDIAVRNFLVDNDGRVLLCDFGLAAFIPDGKDCLDLDSASKDVLLPWRSMAPENFDAIFSTESDIWMYGISLIELITGLNPNSGVRDPAAMRNLLKPEKTETVDVSTTRT